MSERQHAILRWIRANGPITVETATNVFGGHYYTNAAFHTGNTLRRMVANGSLIRVKRGVYGLATSQPTTRKREPDFRSAKCTCGQDALFLCPVCLEGEA